MHNQTSNETEDNSYQDRYKSAYVREVCRDKISIIEGTLFSTSVRGLRTQNPESRCTKRVDQDAVKNSGEIFIVSLYEISKGYYHSILRPVSTDL